MNKCTGIARAAVLCGLVALMPLAASALKKNDFVAVFDFTGGAFTNATLMLSNYNIVTKHGRTADAHPIPGQWHWRAGKKNIRLLWPDAQMEVHALDLDTLTGSYTKTGFAPFDCTLTRTNLTVVDAVINRTRKRTMYGMVLSSEIKSLPLPHLRIVVYARFGTNAVLQTPAHLFRRLGTFIHALPVGYDYTEAYVISNGFVPPPVLLDPLPVDGTNVWAFDWRTNNFKYFDRSTTNNPNVF